jgi:hypothetical protein
MNTKKLVFLVFCVATSVSYAQAKLAWQKQAGNDEWELYLDPYYTSLDYYTPLTGSQIPRYGEESELAIYKKLLASPKPRFLLIEASVYPMPCLGVLAKRHLPDLYEKASLGDDFNLVKSITAGFEEPYALSVFVGNVIDFSPKGTTDTTGKGHIGLLLSAGNYHIRDNEILSDNWLETELKIKGDRITAQRKMAWSFRIGSKLHNNDYIKDVFYFSLKRERSDFDDIKFSIFKNSGVEYTFDVDAKTGSIMRHFFFVDKKFPLKKRKIAFTIGTGVLWEKSDKYTGPLARPGNDNDFQILFRPNIEF